MSVIQWNLSNSGYYWTESNFSCIMEGGLDIQVWFVEDLFPEGQAAEGLHLGVEKSQGVPTSQAHNVVPNKPTMS